MKEGRKEATKTEVRGEEGGEKEEDGGRCRRREKGWEKGEQTVRRGGSRET